MILCCDTSTEYCVLAVSDDSGRLLAERSMSHHRELSVRFYGWLNALLDDAGVRFENIDVLAVGVGPGSFTGVRMAVTTMRTLAQVTGKQLLGISTLDIYANAAADTYPSGRLMAVLPSRRGEVYAGLYHSDGNPIDLPFAASHDVLYELLSAGGITLCGIINSLPDQFGVFPTVPQEAPPGAAFALLAAEAVRESLFSDPFTLLPQYVVAPAISQHKTRG